MKKWVLIVAVILGIYLAGSLLSSFTSGKSYSDRIVVVPIEGEISSSVSGNILTGSSGVSSTELVKKIKDLSNDDSVKGVIFLIDSPGGSVVPSQEISDAIRNLNKTNYAVIREVGASGAYWAASASNKIYASPLSITGSIGVYGSYLEFSKLFDKYGVNYERLISGKYKDLGVPYKSLNDDERKLFQSKLDKIHQYFINDVAKNRNMSVEKVSKLATGEFFLGEEAKENGLIDKLGNLDDAVSDMKKELKLNNLDITEDRQTPSLFEKIISGVSYQIGRGIGVSLTSFNSENNPKINA